MEGAHLAIPTPKGARENPELVGFNTSNHTTFTEPVGPGTVGSTYEYCGPCALKAESLMCTCDEEGHRHTYT